jgi:alcohol dehydrogenase
MMRGLVLADVGRIVVRDDLPEPVLEAPGDALVRVRRAGLCGSDLHPYEGREAVRFGVIPGHEAVGEVLAVGPDVDGVGVGDRVLVPFSTSCGSCAPCRRGMTARCHRSRLFGYGPAQDAHAPALQGAQAQLLRVPDADGTVVPVPAGVDDVAAVLLTDTLPTAWYAAERADVVPGDHVTVVGLGAVGLCAVVAALALGAGGVLAVDPVGGRRRRAEALGAVAATPDDAPRRQHAFAAEGAAAVIEAAGTPAAQHLGLALLRPGGTLSSIAVPTADRFGFTPVAAYDRNLTVRTGRAPVRAVLDRLLPRVTAGEVSIPVEAVVTHPAADLAEGPGLYEAFAARREGLVKAVFAP